MLGRGRECSRRLIASNLQSTIRDLQRRKARGRRGLALIEGVRLVEEALGAGVEVQRALVAPDLARTDGGGDVRTAGAPRRNRRQRGLGTSAAAQRDRRTARGEPAGSGRRVVERCVSGGYPALRGVVWARIRSCSS